MIAEFFGVGIPWLMGISDDEQSEVRPAHHVLPDPSEIELLEIYRGLNDIGQAALMGTARGLAANPDMKKGSTSTHETA